MKKIMENKKKRKNKTLQKNKQLNLLLLEFPANSNMIDAWEHKEEAGFATRKKKCLPFFN